MTKEESAYLDGYKAAVRLAQIWCYKDEHVDDDGSIRRYVDINKCNGFTRSAYELLNYLETAVDYDKR